MLRIDTSRLRARLGHSVVLMAHDEIVCVVPESNAKTLLDLMLHVMKTPPAWGKDIPISAEGDIGENYGDAK
jgi:DNA polymerase I-like protein with 3'-5' exonuclease and polymerase domains